MENAGSRPMTVDDFKDIWNRRKWVFLGLSFAIAALTVIVCGLLPNTYKSECLILVEAPEISAKYSQPLLDTNIGQELAGLIQEAQSRTEINQLARKFRLANVGANGQISDDDLDAIRDQIEIQLVKDNDPRRRETTPYAVKVGFMAGNPYLAQKVTNELAAFFVSEKLKSQEHGTDQAIQLLRTQLDAADKDLQEKAAALIKFKQLHQGAMPIDEPLAVQTLTRLQADLQSNNQLVEKLKEEVSGLTSSTSPAAVAAATGKASSDEQHLQNLKNTLADLQSRYTPNHPDVIKTEGEIQRLEAALAKKAATQPAPTPASEAKAVEAKLSPTNAARLAALRGEINARTEHAKNLEHQIEVQTAMLRSIPSNEQPLDELNRAYTTSKTAYNTLLQKVKDSELAGNIEKSQGGERFRIQDFASLPSLPSSPVRWKINLAGSLAGLFIGLVLAGGLELSDTSMRTEKDAEFYLGVKNLAALPEMPTHSEIQRRTLLNRMRLACTVLLPLVSAAAIVMIYFRK